MQFINPGTFEFYPLSTPFYPAGPAGTIPQNPRQYNKVVQNNLADRRMMDLTFSLAPCFDSRDYGSCMNGYATCSAG